MQRSGDHSGKAISHSVDDEVVFASAPYNIGTFANDLYRISEGTDNVGSAKYNILSDKFFELAEQSATDESINDFVVIKHKGIADAPRMEAFASILENQKNVLLSQTGNSASEKDSRPIHPHSKHITHEFELTEFGSTYAYGNLARYSSEEVTTCVTNAHKQVLEECIYSGKIGTCLISSLVCGLYYGISPAGIKLEQQGAQKRAQEQAGTRKHYSIYGQVYYVENGKIVHVRN
jgi:hypothetical protein